MEEKKELIGTIINLNRYIWHQILTSPCPSGWPGCWHCRPPGPRVVSDEAPCAGDHWSGDWGDLSHGYLQTEHYNKTKYFVLQVTIS